MIGRNLKMQVYLGIAVLFIVATALSSLHHKTPANKVDPNKPPTPMLQDASATNIEEMKREIARQTQEAAHLRPPPICLWLEATQNGLTGPIYVRRHTDQTGCRSTIPAFPASLAARGRSTAKRSSR